MAPVPSAPGVPDTGRIVWIDAARGLSVLLVVVFHVLLWHLTPLQSDMWAPAAKAWIKFNDVLGSLRLPLLLGVSGMLASTAIRTGFADRRNALRIAANYYLYLVWLVVYWIFFLVVTTPDLPHRFTSVVDFLLQLISPDTTLWYVFALAIYTAVLCAVRRFVPAAVQIGLLVLLCIASRSIDIPARQTLKIAENAIFFAVGVHAAPFIRRAADKANLLWVVLAAAVAVVATLAARLSGTDVALSLVFITRGLAFSLWAVLSVAFLVSWRPAARALGAVGKQTLPIYVLHPLGIYLVIAWSQGWSGFDSMLAHPAVSAAYPVVSVAIIVVVCLALHRLVLALRLRWFFELPPALRAKVGR